MNDEATVSVIVPTYGRGSLLKLALDSLLRQTYPIAEIIIVDDGSDDPLPAELTSSSTVRLIRQPHAGRSAARNTGLQAAQGQFIAFLDDDDILPPESIEKRVRYLIDHPTVDVVYTDALAIDAAGVVLGLFQRVNGARPSGQVFAEMLRQNLAPIHAYLFRRGCLEKTGQFDTVLDSAEDWDFWLRMAMYYRFAYLDAPLACYRIHSAMSSIDVRERLAVNGLAVQARAFATPAFEALTTQEQSRLYARHATWQIRTNNLAGASAYYLGAIRANRLNVAAYVLLVMVSALRVVAPNLLKSRFAQSLFRRRSIYR